MVEFEKVGLLLLEEEQRLLQALKAEDEEVGARLRESSATLERQGHSLEMLLLQLEDRNEHSPLQMLQVRGRPASGGMPAPGGMPPAPGGRTPALVGEDTSSGGRRIPQHLCLPGGVGRTSGALLTCLGWGGVLSTSAHLSGLWGVLSTPTYLGGGEETSAPLLTWVGWGEHRAICG